MTQEEILEYNKKCAEFLEMEFEIHSNTWRYKDWITTQLLFHSDWNWIMEVVEAIEELENDDFYMEWFWLNGTNLALYQRHKQNGSNLWQYLARFSDVKTKKEAVVQAINQFLIWRNEQ
jgi:hypothetical protein